MSKHQYTSNTNISLVTKKKTIHPIWRGIGIVMMVTIPIISYILAVLVVRANAVHRWVLYPAAIIIRWQDPYILVKLIIAIFFILIFYAIFTFITALVYRIFGSPRYGPTDVPPERFKRIKR